MRIGMMVDTYKPHISGITNYIAVNKRYLEAAGHEVHVFTFGDEEYKDAEQHIVRSPGLPLIDTGYYLSFRYNRRAKAVLQTMDIVHVHHPFLSGRLALRYCRPLNIPIVFTNHTRYDLYAQVYLSGVPQEISETLLETYMPNFCAAVDMVISPSPGMAAVLRRFRVQAPITIVPNGVELGLFYKTANPAQRAQFGLTDDDVLLVYSGRLAPEKNLPFLLKAFAGVAQALGNTHLLLLGDGPERDKLQEQAQQSGILSRVHFTGHLPYEELPAYLSTCDLFVTASISEVHPLSVIEAMAAGLPVMGIQSVGVGDIVEDEISGFLSGNDLAAFTAKLTRLCLDKKLRQRMGVAAQNIASRYDIQRTSQLMLEHYTQLVQEFKPRQRGLRFRVQSLLETFRE